MRAAIGLLAILPLAVACTSAHRAGDRVRVMALSSDDGVLLAQDDRPVLFYRSRPEPGRESWRTNYVHPLYSVGGAVITEDGPQDHPHQRGVYWAWRRILVSGVQVADGWVGEGLALTVETPRTRESPDGSAQIDVRIIWYVSIEGEQQAIIEENSTIRAFPSVAGRRRVDATVRLRGLRPDVELVGTDDEKGYSGISLRLGHAEQLRIEGDGRELRATLARMDAGRTLSFSWPALPSPWPTRVTVRCAVDEQPWTEWVLRQEPSMQNCAFPGAKPFALPTDRAITLSTTLEIE